MTQLRKMVLLVRTQRRMPQTYRHIGRSPVGKMRHANWNKSKKKKMR
ncbi:MAG: hypothetical protein ACFE8J_08725 [Candidatus Heimdallarchaeota archaeon]